LLTLSGAEPPPRPSAPARAVSFLKPYLLGVAGSIYLFTVGWTRWKNRAAIVELGHHFGYRHESRIPPVLPVVAATALTPENVTLDLRAIDAVDGNVTERELITICRLVRDQRPMKLFELGTFDGRTTLNLAANAPAGAKVFTLDLPARAVATAVSPIHRHEIQYADKPQSGARYRGTDLESRVVSLEGDSGSFDFSPYELQMDFVFIDASHTFEYVINDSLVALKLLRESGGTIVWHDYGRWDGVTAALHELRSREPAFRDVVQVAGTTLAVLRLSRMGLEKHTAIQRRSPQGAQERSAGP
jgi:predicted O-methyltransferase YrrM